MGSAVGALALLVLAGCGGGGGEDITELPAATVLEKSLAAWRTVPSYHVEIHDAGNEQSSSTITVVGTDFAATVVREGARAEIRKVGANRYLRPDDAFWSTWLRKPKPPRAGARWIKLQGDDDLLRTAGLDGLTAFADRTALDTAVPKQVALGDRQDINGVPTITILDTRTTKDASSQISVATTGEPYPIRWDFGLGTVATFTAYGTPTEKIEEPISTDVTEMPAAPQSS